MKFLVAIFAVILTATPVLAQSSGSDAATGLAGLLGMFGLFGFLVALVYSIVLFCLPFIVWKCLRRLTDIRDDIRGLRKELASAPRMSVAQPLPSTGAQYQMNDVSNLQRLVKENEEKI